MDNESRLLADLIGAFKDIGLLDHLEDYQLGTLEREVRAYEREVAFNVLALARDAVVDVRDRDWARLEDCRESFYKMRTLARGLFDFTRLVVHQVDQNSAGSLLGFDFGNHHYEKFVGSSFALIHIANRALADAAIERRFCSVGGDGILFLSSEQHERLAEQDVLWLSEWRVAAQVWTSEQISRFLSNLTADLRSVGLLAHLSEEQITAAEQQITSHEYFPDGRDVAVPWLLQYYPGLAHAFDLEYFGDVSESAITASYAELITGISRVSRGAFVPENLTVTVGPKQTCGWEYVALSFEYGGRTYTRDLEYRGDWVDLSFMHTINQALDDAGQDGRFFPLDMRDQLFVIVFLTDEQLRLVEEKGFPPLGES